ncbi:MAG: MerR family transcriptional regulator [Thermotogota bacterium]
MKLARLAFPGPYPVSSAPLFKLVDCFIHEQFQEAMNFAQVYKRAVSEEITKSRETLKILDRWYNGVYANEEFIAETRKAFSKITGISIDTIRTWERNGLFKPHISEKRRRVYNRFDFEKVQIIRLLRKQGFSIASLYELFNNADENGAPSVFLEKIYKNTYTVCESDEWMNFLQSHLNRADQIIVFIKNRIKDTRFYK